ncbi:hypothetical protein [Bizionia paragorgiae]|uniref:hypothetical protein n=1 Tax=Bizionia paragorgiae TaxID=283786 RepID=UPI003A92C43E
MYTQENKSKENKGRTLDNFVTQKQSVGRQGLDLLDNRSEAIAQRKLQEVVSNSPQTKQVDQLQSMTDNDSAYQQKLFQKKENNTSFSGQYPVAQLQLATGPYRLKNTFFRTNLRNDNDNKSIKAKLPPRQNLMVIPKEDKVSNFKAGLITNEHSWVQTQNNGRGWIEDSMLEPAPFFNQAADQGSFLGNFQNRTNYLQELENHVNLGSDFDALTNTLRVSDARLQEAAIHLNQGQDAQIQHIGNALNAEANPDIYDVTIANHDAKNVLWNQMLAGVDAGQNTAAAPMSDQVKLKTKTGLAQIISTTAGHDVMNQVNHLSGALGIPINYIEEDTQQDYNLYVTPQFGGPNNDVLESLSVILPPDRLFNDAQSFKRISSTNLAGDSDMGQIGRNISVSPVDTDILHEFTHALHYLTFENRRRNLALNHVHDQADYHVQTGGPVGNEVLRNQDNTAEARTIHRNQSFADLGVLAHGILDPTIPATQEQDDAFGRLGVFTHAIPTENDYREALGLGARQDHHAMRKTVNGTFEQMGLEPILSV